MMGQKRKDAEAGSPSRRDPAELHLQPPKPPESNPEDGSADADHDHALQVKDKSKLTEEEANFSELRKSSWIGLEKRNLELKQQTDRTISVGVGAILPQKLLDECDEYCGVCDLKFTSGTKYRRHMFHHKVREREGKFGPIAFAVPPTVTVTPEPESKVPEPVCESHLQETSKPPPPQPQTESPMVISTRPPEQKDDEDVAVAGEMDITTTTTEAEPSSSSQPLQYICPHCPNRRFTNRRSFDSHQKYHARLQEGGWSELDNYLCGKCGSSFGDRMTFATHSNLCDGETDAEEASNKPLLPESQISARNWRASIPYQETYFCSTCPDRTFSKRESYISHLALHRTFAKKGQDRVIQTAAATLKKKNRSRRKQDYDHIPHQESYTCDICGDGRPYANRLSYINHLKYHEKRRFLGRTSPIIRHSNQASELSLSFPHQNTYQCTICENRKYSGSQRKAFISHMNRHASVRRSEGKDRPLLTKQEATAKRFGSRKLIVPDQESYRCEICPDRVFDSNSKASFISHLHYHRQIRKVEGQDRPIPTYAESRRVQTFKSEQRRALLESSVPDQETYSCEICSSRHFSQKLAYIQHLKHHEWIKEREGADRPILTASESRGRERQRQQQAIKTCTICPNRTFTNQIYLKKHMRRHELIKQKEGQDRPICRKNWKIPEEGNFECTLCNRKFTLLSSYRNHLQYHQIIAKKYGQDRPIIARKLPQGSGAKAEAATATADQRSWNCGICSDKTFNTYTRYKWHVWEHRKIREREGRDRPITGADSHHQSSIYRAIPDPDSYTCDLCPQQHAKVYHTKYSYYNHILYHRRLELSQSQTQTRPLSARLKARKLAKKKSKLQDQSLYRCIQCVHTERTFRDRKTYLAHLYNHAKPAMIKRGAVRRRALSPPPPKLQRFNHQQPTPKEGKKKVECGECGKRFVFLSQLVLHQQESCRRTQCNYSCHCGERFHSPAAFDLHKQIGHGEEVCEDGACGICQQVITGGGGDFEAHVRNSHPEDYLEFVEHQKTLGEYYGFEDRMALRSNAGLKPEANSPENSQMDVEKVEDSAGAAGNSEIKIDFDDFVIKWTAQSSDSNENEIEDKGITAAPGRQKSPSRESAACSSSSSSTTIFDAMADSVARGQLNTTTVNPTATTGHFITSGKQRHWMLVHPQPSQATNINTSQQSQGISTGNPITTNIFNVNPPAHTATATATAFRQTNEQQSVLPQTQNPAGIPSGPHFQSVQNSVANPSTPTPVQRQGPKPSKFCSTIYRCFCGLDSYTLTDFLKHQWTHRTEKLFLCPVCQQQFPAPSDLFAHAKACHTEVEAITLTVCHICETLLSSREELSVHYVQKHSIRLRTLCDVCHQSCGSLEELNAHLGTHPTCSICKKVFLNQVDLQGHLGNDHVGQQASAIEKNQSGGQPIRSHN